jgi:60 kDa SS-A/Ro ribonucleoprotein
MAEKMEVPQSEALPGQVPNSAGGFTWAIDDLRRLRRFLCLGSEGGSYYISEIKLGRDNAMAILRLIGGGKGEMVVQEIVKFSVNGRAAKQDPIIFALALCARSEDLKTKKAAYEALSKVCRIPTHLFSFVEFCENLSTGTGWGRAHRRAICEWYNSKTHKDLAMAVTKYKSRNGWSHFDLFRLCHIEPANVGVACVCKYVVKGLSECREECMKAGDEEVFKTLTFLDAVEAAKTADEYTVVKFIYENGLVREHVPSTCLNSQAVSYRYRGLLVD